MTARCISSARSPPPPIKTKDKGLHEVGSFWEIDFQELGRVKQEGKSIQGLVLQLATTVSTRRAMWNAPQNSVCPWNRTREHFSIGACPLPIKGHCSLRN